MSQTQSTTGIEKVGRVMVPVTDQDAAIAFYTEKLGFEVRADVPFGEEGGDRWIEVAPAGAATTLSLAPPRGAFQTGANTGVVLDCADIDVAYAALKDAGVDVDAEISRFGDPVPPMFWFRDQDENILLMVTADQA